MKNTKVLITLLITLCFSITGHAVPTTFSVVGELEDASFAQLFEFDVAGSSGGRQITIETFASDGGVNAAGQVFAEPLDDAGPSMVDEKSEGFEPWLSLFDSSGTLIEVVLTPFPGNESSQPTDLLYRPVLSLGTYTLALTNAVPPLTNLLADGFCDPCVLGSDFLRGPFIDNGPLWAIDFSGIEDVRALPGASRNLTSTAVPPTSAVPEPNGLALLMLSGLLVGGLSCFRYQKFAAGLNTAA